MPSPQQLTLNVGLRDGFRFRSFFTEAQSKNAETVAILSNFTDSGDSQQVILWGQPQSGKTHLLQSCCARLTASQHVISYIPLKHMMHYGVEIFSGLSFSKLIALDDIDCIIGNKDWEMALFKLINQCRESAQKLLMSSRNNPRRMDCVLPDLASRLIWGETYQLHALSDTDKPKALQARAELRGFELSDKVIEYLYRRYPRDIESLMQLLDTLDKESLREKKVITIPFVRKVLESM